MGFLGGREVRQPRRHPPPHRRRSLVASRRNVKPGGPLHPPPPTPICGKGRGGGVGHRHARVDPWRVGGRHLRLSPPPLPHEVQRAGSKKVGRCRPMESLCDEQIMPGAQGGAALLLLTQRGTPSAGVHRMGCAVAHAVWDGWSVCPCAQEGWVGLGWTLPACPGGGGGAMRRWPRRGRAQWGSALGPWEGRGRPYPCPSVAPGHHKGESQGPGVR